MNSCAGKVQHKEYLSAEFYLQNINSEIGANIYKCDCCGFFHIGTKKSKKQNKNRGKVIKSKLFNDGKPKIRKLRY